ncbi:hypothetical protein EV182_000626 [Spiromyces aspiralis]|uniref:Uncharacterized protein n=1 Tax=Spiromyces aspiralis TaxID=68401 RepID=A0ACC1HJC8_9FUNG|nr:hypothetical protein EV182_000626 [Spiromyces aspiralis]
MATSLRLAATAGSTSRIIATKSTFRQFSTSSRRTMALPKLPKDMTVNYTTPKDPYLLSEKVKHIVGKGEVDNAAALVLKSPIRIQSQASWNQVIEGYGRQGKFRRAWRAFIEMKRRGFNPNSHTFTVLLDACSYSRSSSAVDTAQEVYSSIDQSLEGGPQITHANSLLKVYSVHDNLELMESTYKRLPRHGPAATDLYTYTIMIDTYRRRLLAQLKGATVRPKGGERDSAARGRQAMQQSVSEAITRTTQEASPVAMFERVLEVWSDYANDAHRRFKLHSLGKETDTPLLALDAKIVNSILVACEAIIRPPKYRSLGRKGFAVIEQAYGPLRPAYSRSLGDSTVANATVPLTVVTVTKDSSYMGKSRTGEKVFDDRTMDLVLALCKHDDKLIRGMRAWDLLTRTFGPDYVPSVGNYSVYLGLLAQCIAKEKRA